MEGRKEGRCVGCMDREQVSLKERREEREGWKEKKNMKVKVMKED